MKRTTISLTDHLYATIDRYRRGRAAPLPVSTLVQTAPEEYPAQHGDILEQAPQPFHVTPAAGGSGSDDVSKADDRYLAEAAFQE